MKDTSQCLIGSGPAMSFNQIKLTTPLSQSYRPMPKRFDKKKETDEMGGGGEVAKMARC
jgi:hypothetical protein